jgi:branched-chain amino acid transport system substrate-binding protein
MLSLFCISLLGAMYGETLGLEPYKVGHIAPTSGPTAFAGVPERKATEWLIDQINKAGGINGHPMEYLFYDEGGDVSKGILAVRKLIEHDKVLTFIGPWDTSIAFAAIPMIEKANIPAIPAGTGVKVGYPPKKWVFQVMPTNMHEAELDCQFLKKKGSSKIATLLSTDAKGQEFGEWMRKHAPNYKLEIVAAEEMSPDATDVTPQLTKINQSKAEAIVLSVAGTGNVVVQKNKMQLGMNQLLVMGSAYHSKRYLELGGKAAEGCFVPGYKLSIFDQLPESDPSKSVIGRLKKEYRDKYNEDFTIFCGLGWDRMMIVIKALERAKPDLSNLEKAREQIRNEIEKTYNFMGTIGVHSFSPEKHSSSGLSALTILTVKNGEFVIAE